MEAEEESRNKVHLGVQIRIKLYKSPNLVFSRPEFFSLISYFFKRPVNFH